jgi:hypothetical protein
VEDIMKVGKTGGFEGSDGERGELEAAVLFN